MIFTFRGLLEFRSRPTKALWVALVAHVFLLNGCAEKPPVQDDPGYAAQIGFSDLHLGAELNFLNQQVTYVDGKVTNRGPKTVRRIRVRLTFHDVMNQIVLRDEQTIFGEDAQGLQPGQNRDFQVRFDHVPDLWNQSVPDLQIINVRTQ